MKETKEIFIGRKEAFAQILKMIEAMQTQTESQMKKAGLKPHNISKDFMPIKINVLKEFLKNEIKSILHSMAQHSPAKQGIVRRGRAKQSFKSQSKKR